MGGPVLLAFSEKSAPCVAIFETHSTPSRFALSRSGQAMGTTNPSRYQSPSPALLTGMARLHRLRKSPIQYEIWRGSASAEPISPLDLSFRVVRSRAARWGRWGICIFSQPVQSCRFAPADDGFSRWGPPASLKTHLRG